jgi:hypothetical protein
MYSERGISAKLRRLTTPVKCLTHIRGELAIAAHLHVANLYAVGPFGS